jgi:hypothetical protein
MSALQAIPLLGVMAGAAFAAFDRPWALIPVALINPENGLVGGLKFLHRDFLDGDHLDFQVYGTTKGQAEVEVGHRRLDWPGGWRSRLEAEGFYYPESWFGGGNHPRDRDEEIYTPLGGRGALEVGRPLGSGFLAQGLFQARHVDMRDMPAAAGDSGAGITPLGPELPGYRGGWDDLAGLSLELDTRDDERLPSRGWHAGQRVAHSLVRADYAYGWIETWLAAYARPWPDWEFAAKGFQQTVTGLAPF